MRIVKIATGAKYQMGEQFENLLICGILILLQIERMLKNC